MFSPIIIRDQRVLAGVPQMVSFWTDGSVVIRKQIFIVVRLTTLMLLTFTAM